MVEFKMDIKKIGDSFYIRIPYDTVRLENFKEQEIVKVIIEKIIEEN